MFATDNILISVFRFLQLISLFWVADSLSFTFINSSVDCSIVEQILNDIVSSGLFFF